jgi:hypothetical protein
MEFTKRGVDVSKVRTSLPPHARALSKGALNQGCSFSVQDVGRRETTSGVCGCSGY